MAGVSDVTQSSSSYRRVLVADSDATVRWALRLLLAHEGEWQVVGEAADTTALVHAVEIQQPDLVLLDGNLPGLRGHEVSLVTAISACCPATTLIALCVRPERLEMLRSAGVAAFLSKVDPPDRLLAELRSVVAKQAAST